MQQGRLKQGETLFNNDFAINLNDLKPMIALPSADNEIISVADIDETKIDLVLIGGGPEPIVSSQ